MKWSLDDLYTSFDSKEYIDDKNKLDQALLEIDNWSKEDLNGNKKKEDLILDYIRLNEGITSLFSRLAAFPRLTTTVEATNSQASKELDQLISKVSKLTGPEVRFKNFLKNIENLDELIESKSELKDYEFFLKEIKASTEYLLSEKEEIVISEMTMTGSRSWTKLQNLLTSTLKVDLDGESLPLPVVRNYAYSPDSDLRKKAYESELRAYEKIEESSAAALNSIKGEVISLSKLRGFESPLEETLFNSRMTKKTLDAMFEAIDDFLGSFHNYYKRKADLLGHKDGLPFYDLFAPISQVDMSFTYPEAMDYIMKNFSSFSTRLEEVTKEAYENKWLDVLPREGKRGGAFCSGLHSIGQFRILSNFNGSFSNMITLAHELGHGYHGSCLREESPLNISYPMPIAETASIFCETIVTNAALKEASKEEALSILESSISDAGQVIVDIYSRYIFESELFKLREKGDLSVAELKDLMINAQKKAYGSGLDHNFLHPYMWINKTHYYSAGRNFYNFPYAFGLLFAKGLYSQYLEEGEDFIEKYDRLLASTGKKDIVDLGKMVGVNMEDPDFFRSSLRLIEKDIEKFLDLSKN